MSASFQPNARSNQSQQNHVKNEHFDQLPSLQKDPGGKNENDEKVEGKWDDESNLLFIVFIDFHSKIFTSKEKRKSEKVFKMMSNFLGNRTAAQCRSHYQKLILKFKTVTKMKRQFKEYFGELLYSERLREFQESRKNEHEIEVFPEKEKNEKEMKQAAVQTDPFVLTWWEYQQMFTFWQMQMWLGSSLYF